MYVGCRGPPVETKRDYFPNQCLFFIVSQKKKLGLRFYDNEIPANFQIYPKNMSKISSDSGFLRPKSDRGEKKKTFKQKDQRLPLLLSLASLFRGSGWNWVEWKKGKNLRREWYFFCRLIACIGFLSWNSVFWKKKPKWLSIFFFTKVWKIS